MSNNVNFPRTGFVRLKKVLAPDGPIPVSKSSWWQGVRTGIYPKPVKLSPGVTVWRWEDVHALIARLGTGESHD
jgi:predicted DNA-binding transcriptional regulator AlpA